MPLTRVDSLEAAEGLLRDCENEYHLLGERWAKVLFDADVSPLGMDGIENPELATLQDVHLPNTDDDEEWHGTLQSVAAYFSWLEERYASAESDEELLEFDQVIMAALNPAGRYELVTHAIRFALAKFPGSSSSAIPALAKLASQCWTEVEDIFLAHADVEDDRNEVVPLAEVRANLGL